MSSSTAAKRAVTSKPWQFLVAIHWHSIEPGGLVSYWGADWAERAARRGPRGECEPLVMAKRVYGRGGNAGHEYLGVLPPAPGSDVRLVEVACVDRLRALDPDGWQETGRSWPADSDPAAIVLGPQSAEAQ